MTPRTRRRAWTFLWIALGLVLVVRAGVRDRGVITDHLEFGSRVLHGLDLYAPHLEEKPLHAPYPPGFGLLTAPFSLLPERAARIGWALLQVACLAMIGHWLVRALARCAPALREKAHLLLLLTALLASRYLLRDTHGGGGNIINLALVLGAVALAERNRQGTAGWVLGFSLATKPTHLLVVPLLLVLGRHRAALTSLLAAATFTAISLVLLGQGLAPLERWAAGSLAYARMEDVFVEPAYGFPAFTWMNQCLRCAVQRYLGTVPDEFAGQVAWFFPGPGLEPVVTAWVSRGAALALMAATGLVAWRHRSRESATAAGPWLVAAVLSLSLLLSPISWKAHHVALVPAFFLLACRAFAGDRWIWWLFGAYVPLCLLGEELVGRDLKQVQQSLYLVTAGTIAVWAACVRSQALFCRKNVPGSVPR